MTRRVTLSVAVLALLGLTSAPGNPCPVGPEARHVAEPEAERGADEQASAHLTRPSQCSREPNEGEEGGP